MPKTNDRPVADKYRWEQSPANIITRDIVIEE